MRSAGTLAFWTTAAVVLSVTAAFGPRTTVRQLLDEGTAAVQSVGTSLPDSVGALAQSDRGLTAVCQRIRDRLRDTTLDAAQRGDLTGTYRKACLSN